MPSQLRLQHTFEPFSAETTRTYFPSSQQPQKKQKMSLTQTYYIAASARSKLGKEAGRPDHDLRLLVGHANLLDALMIELHEAEREQEAWFNQTVRKVSTNEERKHIEWADTIVEEREEDEDEDDNMSESSNDSDDSDDSYDEEDFNMAVPLKSFRSAPVMITSQEAKDEEEEFYDEEDDEEHALIRTQSHSPPELVDDSDSDDESPPASPPQPTLDFTAEQQRQAIAKTGFFDGKQAALAAQEQAFIEDGFFIPERNSAQLIATF